MYAGVYAGVYERMFFVSVKHRNWQYRDAHAVSIFAQSWIPDKPRAAVQIMHGVGEHSGRYARFARELAENGFAVFAEDHRGHGKTAGLQSKTDTPAFGCLAPGGLRATEAAIAQLTGHIRDVYPDLSLGVFAHSWGSLMAQRMIQRGRLWDAVVLSGSAYRTLWHMESGNLGKKFPGQTGHEWLSRDERVAREYAEDPLTFVANIPKDFGILESLRLFGSPKRGVATDVPMLVISGGDDALNRRPTGLRRLVQAYRSVGVAEVTLRVYPGARHELLNEINSAEVTDYLVDWFAQRLVH